MPHPGIPVKIIVAMINSGFIVLAVLNKDEPLFFYLALGAWSVHALMALISLSIVKKKGQNALFSLQILFVGTLSFMQLRRMKAPQSQGIISPS